MQERHIDSQSFMIKNNDAHLESMRSSKINPKTAFDYEYMNTLTKNPPHYHTKYYNNDYMESAYTIKRIIYTPVKKQKILENDSKQTVLHSNPFCHSNKFKNPFLNPTYNKYENNDKNKENSYIKSNVFSSHSPLTDHEKSSSNTSSGYKLPVKKLDFANNLKDGKFESVRLNLQATFNTDTSNLFSKTRYEQKHFDHPLISCSEGSSQDNSSTSKDNGSSKEKEIFLENFKESKMMLNSQQSNSTISDSIIEGLTKKTMFSIPKEKTNDEKYKLLALKKIRKSTHKDNKSASKLDVVMKNAEGRDNYPESMMQCNLFGKGRKIIHSVKKIYASEIALVDPLTYQQKKFRIFKDSDIGINQDWQKYLKESNADEDIPTDEELLTNATKFVQNSLMESITYLFNNRDSNMVNNIGYMQKR